MPILASMDVSLFEDLNGFASRHGAIAGLSELLATDAIFLLGALIVLFTAAPGRWSGGVAMRTAASAAISATAALVLAKVISSIAQRPRPFAAPEIDSHTLIASATDYSLPSDHATAAFAVAAAIALRIPRIGIPALVLATLIAASRVAVGVHYPLDVTVGAALGIGCAAILHLARPRAGVDRIGDLAARATNAVWSSAYAMLKQWKDRVLASGRPPSNLE